LPPADASAARAPGAAAREHPWRENRPPARWLPELDARELWRERELAVVLALKDLRIRYKQTFFGVAWALLQPLLAVLVFSVVFGRLAGLPADGIPYPVFVYAGLVAWLYFAAAVSAAAQSLVDNRDLVTKVYFPRLLAPLAAVCPPLVDLLVNLLVVAVFLAAYTVAPGPALLVLPAWILAALVLALAAGLGLAALNVKYRDVRHALPFLLQVWLFASPVVYAASLVEGGWRYLYAANPMVTVIGGFRWSLAGGPAPGLEALVSLLVGAVLLLAGFVYFRRVERHFADLI
jgi:ABC-type polysaccharide/polyol phosphate export permease